MRIYLFAGHFNVLNNTGSITNLYHFGTQPGFDFNINLNLSASRHSLNRSHQYMSPQLNRSGYPSSGEGEEQAVKSGDEEMRVLDSESSGR